MLPPKKPAQSVPAPPLQLHDLVIDPRISRFAVFQDPNAYLAHLYYDGVMWEEMSQVNDGVCSDLFNCGINTSIEFEWCIDILDGIDFSKLI